MNDTQYITEYFGHQWGIGRRNDNPTVFQFGYNDIIYMQSSVIIFTGNTRGKYKNKKTTSWNDVDNQLLPQGNSYILATHIYIRRYVHYFLVFEIL